MWAKKNLNSFLALEIAVKKPVLSYGITVNNSIGMC